MSKEVTVTISSENKAIAEYAVAAFGGKPSVRAYHLDTINLVVDVLRCDDAPSNGVTSYSTLRLSDCEMVDDDGRVFPTRIELAGACATTSDLFPNVLSSASFHMMRNKKLYRPGSVLAGYVYEYYPESSVPHLFFTSPFLWEDRLKTLQCETKQVAWLLAVPISNAEREFLNAHGDDALENRFVEHQIDVFDLSRASVC